MKKAPGGIDPSTGDSLVTLVPLALDSSGNGTWSGLEVGKQYNWEAAGLPDGLSVTCEWDWGDGSKSTGPQCTTRKKHKKN